MYGGLGFLGPLKTSYLDQAFRTFSKTSNCNELALAENSPTALGAVLGNS